MEEIVQISSDVNVTELIELLKRRLAHQSQHALAGVFGCHFQSSAHMFADQFTRIFHRGLVARLVLTAMQQQVVTYTTTDETLLDTLQGVYGMIDIQQFLMVGVEVGANLRMDTTGTLALLAGIEILAMHAVHIGRGSSQIGEITFEIRHLYHLLHLF